MRRLTLPATIAYASYAIGVGFALSIIVAMFPQWWLTDLFSHFRIQYVLAGFLLLPVCLWLKKYLVAAIALVAIVIHSYSIWPYLQANVPSMNVQAEEKSQAGYKIVFANIYYKSDDFEPINALIKKHDPDVLIFAEVNEFNYQALAEKIDKNYPYHDHQDGLGAYDISYFSKEKPVAELLYFTEDNPSWMLSYQKNNQQLRLLGLHPHSPTSRKTTMERNEHLKKALRYVSSYDDPTVIVGDFNISQFSKTFQELLAENQLIDTQLEFGLQPSWHAQMPSLFRIPIDQVVVNDAVEVLDRRVGESTGSDHFPVIVSIDW